MFIIKEKAALVKEKDGCKILSVAETVREVKPAEKPVHKLCKVFLVGAAARQYVVLRYAVHSACDEVNEVDAAVPRNVAEEVFAFHE